MRIILGTILASILLLGCKKKDTVWTTEWNAPIINDTLNLLDLVNDSTLQEDPGGFYHLGLDRLIYKMGINDVVEIPDTTIVESFTIAFANLTINPGFSFINSTEEHDLNLPLVQLRKVILSQGSIDIVVKNPIGTKAIFNVKLPGVEKDGVPFEYEFTAPAGTNANPGIAQQTIILNGYTIDLTGITGGSFNKLQSLIQVTSDPSGPSVNMTNQDITYVEATFRDVKIAYARGYFGDQTISDTIDKYLEMFDVYNAGLLDLPNSTVSFQVENGMKLSGEGLLTNLNGINSAGTSIDLSGAQVGSSFNIDPATGSWSTLTPSVKTITFNNSNSNLESFLENLPSKVNVGYSFQLNPWGNISGGWDEIFPSSRLKVRLLADMPMMIGADALVLQDTFKVDLSNGKGTKINSGNIILNVANSFPISADIDLMLLDESGSVLHTISGSEIVKSAQFGQFDVSLNMNVAESEVRFYLNENVIADIEEVHQIVVRSRFDTTDPGSGIYQQMMIPVGAFMHVKARTEFKTENVF